MNHRNSFAGGTASTAVTTANSGGTSGDAFDAVTLTGASSITFDRTHAVGSMAVKHVVAAGGDAYYAWNVALASKGTLYGRVYVWFDSLPTSGASARIVRGTTADGLRFAIDLVSRGNLRVVDSQGGKVFFTSESIATGRWVRIEWRVDFGSGTLELRLYNDAGSTTPTEDKTSAAGRPFGAGIDQVQFGRSGGQNVPATFWSDEPALSGSGFPGPAA